MRLVKITQKLYNQLEYLPFNRQPKPRKDLETSMNKRGFVVPIILLKTNIFGKDRLFIADGQHRLLMSQYLGITAYAIIVDYKPENKDEIVEFVANLNSSHKSWKIEHYVDSFVYLGYKDYEILSRMSQKYPYTVSTLGTMLYGYRRSGWVTGKIQTGKFVINHMDATLKTLEYAADLSKIERLSAKMLLGLHYICSLRNFDYDNFKEQYRKNAACAKELSLDDYADLFEEWLKI